MIALNEDTQTTEGADLLLLLNDLSRGLNIADQNSNAALIEASNQLISKLPIDAVAIWTLEHDTNFMKIETATGLSERFVRFFNKTDRIALGKGLVGGVIQKRQSLFINKLAEYKNIGTARWNEMLNEEGIVSVLAAPILAHEVSIGVLTIYYKKEHSFSDSERLFFEILANQLAVIISSNHQYQQLAQNARMLENQVENMTNIQKTTQVLNRYLHDSLDVSLSYVADYFTKKFNVKSISVFKSDDHAIRLSLVASHGLSEYMRGYFESHVPNTNTATFLGSAYHAKEPKISARVFTDERISKDWVIAMAMEKQVAMGAFPLIVQGNSIGVLVTTYDHLHVFSSEELTILNTFAQFFAVALENASTFESLASERRKIKSMVDSIEDGLLVYDMNGNIIDVNPRAMKLFQITNENFLGKKPSEIMDDPSLQPLQQVSQLTLIEGETRELNFDYPLNIYLHVTHVSLRDEDGVSIGSMRVLHDFTQERVVERLKSNFVATASHQLRTPLTGIKWGLLALTEGHKDNFSVEQKRLLERIIFANNSVIGLINDILNVGRIEEGKFEYTFSLGTIADIVDELLANFQMNIEGQELHIEKEYGGHDMPLVMRDREKFSLAIRNLLDNAIKYTKKGGTITIKTWVDQNFLKLSVHDTGIGIPEKDIPFLFNKFYRAPNAVRLQTEGSGLGLFFTKSIVDKHNGVLSVESHEGAGSTFIITLPLDRSQMPGSTPRECLQ